MNIALTFDDGPSPDITPAILDTLEKYRVPASFFVLGEKLTPQNAPIVRRACALGCEICGHSFSHPDLTALSPAKLHFELTETARRIEALTGRPPAFFRPPYIAVNDAVLDAVTVPVVEGYGAEDFRDEITAAERHDRILAQLREGMIILLHDMEDNRQTAAAVETLVPALLERGCVFHTMTGLFAAAGITPQRRILYSYAQQTTFYAQK